MDFSFLQLPRFERDYKHTVKDWLGISIVAAAAIVAALFILTQLTHYLEESAARQIVAQLQYPQARYDVAKANSTSTPEKTYEAFRQALLNNDLDGALKLIYPSARKKYEGWVREDYQAGKFKEVVKNFTPIEKVWSTEDSAYYKYVTPPSIKPGLLSAPMDYVSFTRDMDGIWKIDAI